MNSLCCVYNIPGQPILYEYKICNLDIRTWGLTIVFTPSDSGIGTIYVSDDRGIVFSKSLERHLYTTTGGDTDFTNITSLRGVYMTSVLAVGKAVTVIITH